MILVADAAPLIFLAKINRLALLTDLYNAEILVPAAVSEEVLGPDVPPDEERLLSTFLSNSMTVELRNPTRYAGALSFADNCILTLASQKMADIILSDDRLLRKTAVIEGFRVIGTLGILLRATKSSLLKAKETENLLSELVEEHHFRISTSVYEAARKARHRRCQSIVHG